MVFVEVVLGDDFFDLAFDDLKPTVPTSDSHRLRLARPLADEIFDCRPTLATIRKSKISLANE